MLIIQQSSFTNRKHTRNPYLSATVVVKPLLPFLALHVTKNHGKQTGIMEGVVLTRRTSL